MSNDGKDYLKKIASQVRSTPRIDYREMSMDSIIAIFDGFLEEWGRGGLPEKPEQMEYLRRVLEAAVIGLKHQVDYDFLTDLYNEKTFYAAVEKTVSTAEKENIKIVCMDLDRFKLANDLLGATEGDKILSYVAGLLRKLLPNESVIGRLIGDIFAFTINMEDRKCEKLLSLLDAALLVYKENYKLTASYGIYRANTENVAAVLMCDRAILALKTVKGNFLLNYAYYASSFRDSLVDEHEIVQSMRQALEDRQFVPYYQPIVNCFSNTVVGIECLVRWRHPQKGLLKPDKFLPIFEKNGFIAKLDWYIWEEAISRMHKFVDADGKLLYLGINVSRAALYEKGFAERLESLAEKYAVPPQLIAIELNEKGYMDVPSQLLSVVYHLRSYGFRVVMDDFGSGYSSLNCLRELPLSVLKLDVKLLGDVQAEERSSSIVQTIVRMARWLGLVIIVDEVGTKEQVEALRGMGCAFMQGRFFASPMSEDELVTFNKNVVTRRKPISAKTKAMSEFNSILRMSPENTLLFNSMVGAVAIVEYEDAVLEVVRYNDEFAKLLKLDAETMEGFAHHVNFNIINMVDAEYRKQLIAALNAGVALGAGGDYVSRWRLSNGAIVWMRFNFKVLAAAGNHFLLMTMLEDVTESKLVEESLRRNESFLHEQLQREIQYKEAIAADSLSVLEADLSADVLVRHDTLMESKVNYSGNCLTELMKRIVDCIVYPDFRADFERTFDRENLIAVALNGQRDVTMEYMASYNGGETYVWVQTRASFVIDPISSHWFTFAYTRNIDVRKRRELGYRKKAERDSLTGLYNRDAMQVIVQHKLETTVDEKKYVAFIIFDLDDFKQVNDTFGHLYGDTVLVHMAELLSGAFRERDCVCRLGGDEFVVFVSEVERREIIVNRIKSINVKLEKPIYIRDKEMIVTASIGLVICPAAGQCLERLYAMADIALYKAKKAGKNQWHLFEENEDAPVPDDIAKVNALTQVD